MTTTLDHTESVEPFEDGLDGSYRTWWAADGERILALSVLHYPNGRPALIAAMPSMPSVGTTHGTFTLDAFYSHEPVEGSDGCRFHDDCEPSALSGRAFSEAWQRIAAADVTVNVVRAELAELHATVFEVTNR